MKAILYSCGALLLTAAMLPATPLQAQAGTGQKDDSAATVSTWAEIQQLRDALAARNDPASCVRDVPELHGRAHPEQRTW